MRKTKGHLTYLFGLFGLLLLTILSTGCTNENRQADDDEGDGSVFIDYNITGDEQSGYLTVRAQFRAGGPSGRAFPLEPSSRIQFDGESLIMDSSRMNGAWYELIVPASDFSGSHELVFSAADGTRYSERFDFDVISFQKLLPATISRDSLEIVLDGLKKGDLLSILFTDTAFYSRGLERFDTVSDGTIHISPRELANLANGPVTVEFIKEYERDLQNPQPAGGRLHIAYSVRRVVELVD